MKKFFFMFFVFPLFLISQDSSWWETFKGYEEKLKKISEDFQREYERAKTVEEIKERRERREKKISPEYQKKAMEEVSKFLRDKIGNNKGAEFIENMYKNGNIVWGDEDSSLLGKTTLDINHLYEIYDDNYNVNFSGLIKLTATIIHESIHSGQWGAYFGMTSNANEEEAYFGTLSAIALWIQEMEKKLEDKNIKDPCTKSQNSENLENILSLLFYYDSIMYEKSTESREKISQKKEKESINLQILYEMRAKAKNNLNWLNIYQDSFEKELKKIDLSNEEKNYLFQNYKKVKEAKQKWEGHLKKIEKNIQDREAKIKNYEAQLNEPQLDITKFQWKDEKGNIYNRDKLLKMAKEKQKLISHKGRDLKKECEEKISKEKEKISPDTANLPKENIKDKKSEIFSCLCRCGVPMGVWGGFFPEPISNTSPSCEKPGFCAAGNWGCYRFYPPLEGSCFHSCIKSSGADGDKLRKEILSIIQRDFDALINTARKIMEEYLNPPKTGSQLLKEENLFANGFQRFLSDVKTNYDLQPESFYLKKIREKNKKGDPDLALSLVKEAEEIKKSCSFVDSSGLVNLRIEFAIILAKAALNVLPELAFDDGIYMLDKALSFFGEEKSPRVKEIKDLKVSFLKWKDAWNTVMSEVPVCLNFIKNKEVCNCEDLYQKKILPSLNLLNIYGFASSDRWQIFNGSGVPVRISKKEKFQKELKESLEKAKKECENNPALNTKEMKELKNYYSYKIYEGSSFTDKENLKKYSATPICGVNAKKIAEKILSGSDLCDCQKKELQNIIEIAKNDGLPMSVYFDVRPKEIKLGERAILELKIKGGKPPYNHILTGSLEQNVKKDPSPGFVYDWRPEKAGTHTFNINVGDSCGEVFQKEVTLYVKNVEKVKGTEKIEDKMEEKKPEIKQKDEKKEKKQIIEKDKETEKIKEEKEKKQKGPSDLNGNWIVNCGDNDINSLIIQKGNFVEIKIEDYIYKGYLNGSNFNLKSIDGMEEIYGTLINENEIRIKIIDKNFPQNPSYCNFKKANKVK